MSMRRELSEEVIYRDMTKKKEAYHVQEGS
jgi:hypothetical protein